MFRIKQIFMHFHTTVIKLLTLFYYAARGLLYKSKQLAEYVK